MDLIVIGSQECGKSSVALQLGTQYWKRKNDDFERALAKDDQETYFQLLPLDVINSISEVLETDFIPPPLFHCANEYKRTIMYQCEPLDLHIVERPADNRYLFRSTGVILVYDGTTCQDADDLERYVLEQWDTLLNAPFKGRPNVRGRRPIGVFISKWELIEPLKMRDFEKCITRLYQTFGEGEISIHFVSAVRARGIEEALPSIIANQLAYNNPPRIRETFRGKIRRKRRSFVMMSIFTGVIFIGILILALKPPSVLWPLLLLAIILSSVLCGLTFGVWYKEDSASEYMKSSCLPSQFVSC
eukprot:TRINITY_DN7179_c0_g1_i1.p1 TRINITY_DN7179_c0_g1~~TRINITY_DN7179_c0_g1_i1.p1  ORF type:complete len:302 (+),score=50.66 TRINITY_DN7179_c0_g1_i1:67-972(+)